MDRATRLIISAIHLDAAVEMVGLKANGDLDTPQEYSLDDVGWYKMGPEPGAHGSAVIDGHLDRPGGSPAVFWYLNRLQIGDGVTVLTSQGRTLHFRVTHMQTYQPQAAPLQAIFGDMSGHYLNLITCAGDWIPTEHQTTLRLVVYTSLVSDISNRRDAGFCGVLKECRRGRTKVQRQAQGPVPTPIEASPQKHHKI